MTRLSDDAWRARMEGKKTVREAAPLPLFDAKPDPVAEAGRLLVEGVKSAMPDIVPAPPTKGLDGMLAQHERDHAAALGIPPDVLASAPPPSTAAQETDPRRPITSEEVKAHAKAIGSAAAINHPPYTREDGYVRPKLPNDEAADPWARAHAGSALAARRWTPEEVARVDAAIRTAAATGREFTADDVWELLPGLLVTKGLAGRLMAAANAGLIRNTGKTAQARRGGEHDHAQRLSVWQGTGGAS